LTATIFQLQLPATHGLFLKLNNLTNRQDAKAAKTNKFDVFACGETTSGNIGVLGVLAVKNAAYVVLQEKTMVAMRYGYCFSLPSDRNRFIIPVIAGILPKRPGSSAETTRTTT
jgi:hypothetical protein